MISTHGFGLRGPVGDTDGRGDVLIRHKTSSGPGYTSRQPKQDGKCAPASRDPGSPLRPLPAAMPCGNGRAAPCLETRKCGESVYFAAGACGAASCMQGGVSAKGGGTFHMPAAYHTAQATMSRHITHIRRGTEERLGAARIERVVSWRGGAPR